MSLEPKIRLYRPGDEVGVSQVARAGFEQSIRPYYTQDGVMAFGVWTAPEMIAKRQSNGKTCMVVAELEGQIVGVAELDDFTHLSMLFVHLEVQCCGIARRLLTRLETLRKKVDSQVGDLTTYAVPSAVEAYRHLGFKAEGGERAEQGIRFVPMRRKS